MNSKKRSTKKPPKRHAVKGKRKNPNNIFIGKRIKEARTAKGMTQIELAHAIGLTGDQAGACVCRWEYGEQEPRWDNLARIAGALDVTMVSLLPPQSKRK
jgi:transcriptional regulator with XRE-family HTH domain